MLIHRLAVDEKDGLRKELELQDGWNVVEDVRTDWDGAAYVALYGPGEADGLERVEMECEADGRRLRVVRTADGAFDASEADGNAAEGLSAENCGEVLTGLSAEAYRRTARIAWPGPDADAAELRERLDRSQARMKALEEREASLNRELHDEGTPESGGELSADADPNAPPDLSVLTAAYEAMKRKLDEDHVPELDAISRLRGAIVNIMTAGKQLDKAEAEQEAAERVLAEAKAAAEEMPFAGMTPEEAEQTPLRLPFNLILPPWAPLAFGGVIAVGALFLFHSPGAWYPVAWVLFVALGILSGWGVRKWNARWEVIASERRDQRDADLIEYARRYRAMEEARAEADVKISAADTLRESLSTNERAILRDIHRFAPEVSSMSEADAQLRLCARRRKDLAIAEAVVRKAAALQAQQEEAEPLTAPVVAVIRDAPPREKLVQALNAVREERAALRLEIRRDKLELSERPTPAQATWTAAREAADGDALTPEFAGRVTELCDALSDGRCGETLTAQSALDCLSGADDGALQTALDAQSYGDAFCLAVRLAAWERTPYAPLFVRGVEASPAVLRVMEGAAELGQVIFIRDNA